MDVVRNEAQRARALAEIDEARALGFGEDDVRWLGPDETEVLIGAAGVLGATFTPHCAVLQPALLARGLADAVERRGVRVYEHTEVLEDTGRPGGRPPVGPHRGRHRAGGIRGARHRGLDAHPARPRA